MTGRSPVDKLSDGEMPEATDVAEALEPEVRDGPLGMPVVVPRSCPDIPGADSNKVGRRRY